MRTIQTTLHLFDELSDDAKEKARDWFRGPGFEFAWASESLKSIQTFCDYFGVTITKWFCNPYERPIFYHNATKDNFLGLCLSQFDPDYMPTGYCLDAALWHTFYAVWKAVGDSADLAFEKALEAAFQEWREDMEYQLTDESVDDNIRANEYEFLADGTRFTVCKRNLKGETE